MQIFFHKDHERSKHLFHEIEAACEGLIYLSETDAPVTAFAGMRAVPDREKFLHQAGFSDDQGIEERSFSDLFARLTSVREWYGDAEKERAKKFLELQKLLEENLYELKVFRVGSIRLDIFAVGVDKNGYLMGVRTHAVET